MKKKLILLSIAVFVIVSVNVANLGKEKEPPSVAFSLLYMDLYYYSVWTIDSQGNIYCFHDDWNLCMEDYESRMRMENCKYIKSIEEKTVKDKYAVFQDILADKHYEKNLVFQEKLAVPDIYLGTKDYYAYTYNRKNQEEFILMHGAGDMQYLSEDKRMKELADWMEDLLREDLWEYDKYCKELKTEEYLKEREKLESSAK